MGVYVPGMEIPDDCRICPMLDYRDGVTKCGIIEEVLARDYKPIPFDGVPDWCPLIEVKTPHGRLIDVDDLVTDAEYDEMECNYVSYSSAAIRCAEALIEEES